MSHALGSRGVSLTEGGLLGGRVRYTQLHQGYRTGLEPVLLAASIPAKPGETVLEAGSGAGAGLLCLAARVPGISGLGLEREPELAALAAANFQANGWPQLAVATQDVLDWVPGAVFDHAFANPPWHDPDGPASPDPLRDAAKRSRLGLLTGWCTVLGKALRRRGTLSLILPVGSLADGMAALTAAKCPEINVFPLWKKPSAEASLVILRGVRLGGGGCRISAGLVLHRADGALTDAAEAVLRRGEALLSA